MKIKQKLIYLSLFFAMFLGSNYSLLSQNKTVKGVVTDEQGNPIPGVSIIQKGTTKGTVTDFDGLYQLLASTNSTLVFN